MIEQTCPLIVVDGLRCNQPATACTDGYRVQCNICKGCVLNSRLVRSPGSALNLEVALGGVCEMKTKQYGEPKVEFDDNGLVSVSAFTEEAVRHCISKFPNTINERAAKLLEALSRKSSYFGECIELFPAIDFPMAYARTSEEFKAFVNFLDEVGYIRLGSKLDSLPILLSVTAKGHEACRSRQLSGGVTIFVSSTCFDLIDCRAELAAHLQELGFNVLLSDMPEYFEVSKSGHSIESCLFNIGKSNLVVCLIDQRYGPTLEAFGYPGKSATEVEIAHARKLGLPIRYFIRKQAFMEHGLMRNDPEEFSSQWVEAGKGRGSQRKKWFDFVTSCKNPPADQRSNNWIDQFVSSVDLKRIVAKRIQEIFN